MADVPVTVAEMSGFIRDAEKLLSAEATRELVTFVAWHPDAGDLIAETVAFASCVGRAMAWANGAVCA